MKKTTNSNPLKYFNDEKAKRVAKLTKYQAVGEVNENAKNIISRYDSMNKKLKNDIRDKYIKNITGQDTIEKKKFNKEYPDPIFIDPNTGGMINKKKGGAVKTKKKK